jgi:hypothetical protein
MAKDEALEFRENASSAAPTSGPRQRALMHEHRRENMVTGQELVDHLATTDFDVFSYSGRSMYGKKCVAVRLSSYHDLFGLGQELSGTFVSTPTLDQLGKGMVAYWPNISADDVKFPEDD